MRMRIVMLALLLASSPAWAIFTNGGFETGNFTGWTFTIGTNPGLSGSPPFTGASVVIASGGSNTSAVVGAGQDPRAPQLTLPRAGSFTARVNDFNNGAIINSIKQSAPITSADIDPADGQLHVRFSYAAVLEDPGHAPQQQPYFFVRLRDLTKGTVLYEDFTYSGQPGKTFTTTVWSGTGTPWNSNTQFQNTDIVVPMSALNDTLEIETLGADCSLGGHGGYVYLDGFGSAVVPPSGPAAPAPVGTGTDIPTLSEWALILLSMLLAALGMQAYRRRS